LVSDVPEHFLAGGPFRALSADEVVELRRELELEIFGEYKTPAIKSKAVAKPVEATNKEGDK